MRKNDNRIVHKKVKELAKINKKNKSYILVDNPGYKKKTKRDRELFEDERQQESELTDENLEREKSPNK